MVPKKTLQTFVEHSLYKPVQVLMSGLVGLRVGGCWNDDYNLHPAEVGTLGYGIHEITCLTLRERLSKTNILSCEIMGN